jgi:DNA-binding GntR family transcriptional regulator
MSAPTARERAYRELKRRILQNEAPPGSQYLESALAESLSVSRTPVREAAIRLAKEGLVEIRPRHGILVLPVSARDMAEIYELLTELESLAARRVAARKPGARDLAELERATEEMAAALQDDDLERWAAADARFHDGLVALCGNRRLQEAYATYRDQAQRTRMLTLRLRPKPVQSMKDHAALLKALKRGDAEAAASCHRQHRERAGKLLTDLLSAMGMD